MEEGSERERGMGTVSSDEPLGKSSSLVASSAALAGTELEGAHARGRTGDSLSSVSMSVFSGLGCAIVSRSLACRRSARACSTGPNTLARSLVRFAFLLLARAPLAIVSVCGIGREYLG